MDIEAPQKVSMTLAALMGVRSFGESKDFYQDLKAIIACLFHEDFWNEKKKYVILFLEGDSEGTGTFTLTIKQKKDKLNLITVEGGYSAG